MEIKLSKHELKQAIQEYVFKKLGDTAYIEKVRAVQDFSSHELEFDYIKVSVAESQSK